MPTMRAVVWTKEQNLGYEYAEAALGRSRLEANGVAIGTQPGPYRLSYDLTTTKNFVTERLRVHVRGPGWRRSLDLRRDGTGTWAQSIETDGDVDLPDPGGDIARLTGALDCDLGLSPLTNTMPVLRHDLLRGGGPIEFLMAWVSVPDLGVHPSDQRYTFIGGSEAGSIVRYESGSFASDLEFDGDGLVITYPKLARRTAG